MADQFVSQEESLRDLRSPDTTDSIKRYARSVIALHRKLGTERAAAARVQTVGQSLLRDNKLSKECLKFILEGWSPQQSATGNWYWSHKSMSDRAMTPAQSDLMRALHG